MVRIVAHRRPEGAPWWVWLIPLALVGIIVAVGVSMWAAQRAELSNQPMTQQPSTTHRYGAQPPAAQPSTAPTAQPSTAQKPGTQQPTAQAPGVQAPAPKPSTATPSGTQPSTTPPSAQKPTVTKLDLNQTLDAAGLPRQFTYGGQKWMAVEAGRYDPATLSPIAMNTDVGGEMYTDKNGPINPYKTLYVRGSSPGYEDAYVKYTPASR